jgi:hypothetical protein
MSSKTAAGSIGLLQLCSHWRAPGQSGLPFVGNLAPLLLLLLLPCCSGPRLRIPPPPLPAAAPGQAPSNVAAAPGPSLPLAAAVLCQKVSP